MGASTSIGATVIKQDAVSKIVNDCGSVTASNVGRLKNVTIAPPEWCGRQSSFTYEQNAAVDAKCIIDNVQKTLTSTDSTASAESKAALGIATTISKQELDKTVKNIIENKCTDAKSLNELELEGVTIRACKSRIIQVADAQTACKLKNAQDLVDKVVAKNEAKASGFNPLDLCDCGSAGKGVVWAIVILAVVGIAIFALWLKFRGGDDNDDDLGVEDSSDPPPYGDQAVFKKAISTKNARDAAFSGKSGKSGKYGKFAKLASKFKKSKRK
jgi:hypothetical protein